MKFNYIVQCSVDCSKLRLQMSWLEADLFSIVPWSFKIGMNLWDKGICELLVVGVKNDVFSQCVET